MAGGLPDFAPLRFAAGCFLRGVAALEKSSLGKKGLEGERATWHGHWLRASLFFAFREPLRGANGISGSPARAKGDPEKSIRKSRSFELPGRWQPFPSLLPLESSARLNSNAELPRETSPRQLAKTKGQAGGGGTLVSSSSSSSSSSSISERSSHNLVQAATAAGVSSFGWLTADLPSVRLPLTVP
ncbi:hypothetical protein K0M31_019336 [Melipona bicolor]|uniref:Uncharacterized protein n=1 Tax=Melipona bicolor TaxID=60889 RepID=A0AA40G215_9HYME|nr:hypothetical protein K0M31_019336 [Melipona bicolor]